jgi:Domain of unknown function(DUF2779)
VAIPYHARMRPYEQVAFQWSCHTIREKDGNLEHTEWINVVDAFPNFAFAEALMEQMRRYRYPNVRLERWLDLITKRDDNPSPFIIDMCALAKDGYFHPKMKGKLSLKYVLPAVWENSEGLHTDPAFAKYYRRVPDGTVVNPYEFFNRLFNRREVVMSAMRNRSRK